MKAIAKAHQNRSLGEFEGALKEWKEGFVTLSLSVFAPSCFHLNLFILKISFLSSNRAFERPDHSIPSRSAVRHPARAEPRPDHRALLTCSDRPCGRTGRTARPGGGNKVRASSNFSLHFFQYAHAVTFFLVCAKG